LVAETVGRLDCQLVVEPGRRIAGPAGVLLARVIAVKDTPSRRFLIVDAGMNDLIRPSMYAAHHPIWPIRQPVNGVARSPADVVGPVCESADRFAVQRALPPLAEGDLIAFGAAGAYSAVMASEYNGRPLVPEVLSCRGAWSVIRARPSFEEMLASNRLPSWLSAAEPPNTGGAE
jgi:diaminopimelate decarboxylase